jgi:cytoskeletal protein CcmA (bactofilin family)
MTKRPSAANTPDDFIPLPEMDVPEGVTSLGRTIAVKGELSAAEHLIIEGRFEGQLAVPDHGLAIGRRAAITAEILARTITVLGQVNGNLTAAEKVEIRSGGSVEGRIVASKVAIEEGAYFKGSVDPKRTEAAMAVGRHRMKQKSTVG